MRKVLLGVAAAVLAAMPQPALACSCVRSPLAGRVARADVVFTAMVTAVETPSDWRRNAAATLAVDRVYRGDVTGSARVETPQGEKACGVEFVPAERYTVFADVHGRALVTDFCSGTEADAALLEGRKWRPPIEAAAIAFEPIGRSRTGSLAAAALVLAVAAAGLGTRWLRGRAARAAG